jgi:integrase
VTGNKTKVWTGFWFVTADGVRKQRSKVLGRKADLTKGQARAALRAIITAPPTAPPTPVADKSAAPQTFAEATDHYIQLKQTDWGKKMRGTMKSLFATLINPTLGHRKLTEILPSDCKALFNSIASAGKSKSTIDKCVTHVRAVFDFQIEDGHLLSNPAKSRQVSVPKSLRKIDERFLSLDDCQKLFAVAEGYDLMLLKVMLGTALRPSEAFALRVEDIERGRLRIDEAAVPNQPLGATKTEDSNGHVPISTELEAELREYAKRYKGPKAFLFPNEVGMPMNRENYLHRVLKRLGVEAGLGDINFQMFRRTVATNLQDHGPVASAQGLLRHSSSVTTLRNYQKQIPDGVRQAANSWDAALRQKRKPKA